MLAACVDGEHHDLGLRMIVALLRERGQRVQFLGADVGARFLREEVAMRRPCALLLSATLPERLPAIAATAAAVAGAAAPQPLLFLGGQAVSGHEAGVQLLGVTPIGEPDLDAALHTILSTALPASAS
jgi:methanogenic corrinoid protein MtbC1